MRIEPIDLRPPATFGQNSRWLWAANAVLIALLMGVWFWQYQGAKSGSDELLSDRTRALSANPPAHPLSTVTTNVPQPASAASAPAHSMPFDWDLALQALEQVSVSGVNLHALKIDALKQETTLTVSFQTYGQVGKYLTQLAAYPALGRCAPLNAEGQEVEGSLGESGRALLVCTLQSTTNGD